MSSEERRKILQMVEEGKVSAEDAARLMHTLEEDADDESAEAEIGVIESEPASGYESDASSGSRLAAAPEFDEIKARARRFSQIPLWIGVIITVFSAWVIYSIQQNAGVNFWFYFMTLPLLFGVLLIALGAGGYSSRWIYVDVDRRNVEPDGGPQRITLGLPIPLDLVAWFFDKFGHNINGMDNVKVNGIVQMLRATKESSEPFMVNVDDDDAHVQVFIG